MQTHLSTEIDFTNLDQTGNKIIFPVVGEVK